MLSVSQPGSGTSGSSSTIGHVAGGLPQRARGVHVRRHDDQAVHPPAHRAQHVGQLVPLARASATPAGGSPSRASGEVRAVDDLGEELAVQVGQQQPQRVRPVRDQAAGDPVGPVAERARGRGDPPPRLLAHQRAVVEDARHGRDGHVAGPRHVADGRRAGVSHVRPPAPRPASPTARSPQLHAARGRRSAPPTRAARSRRRPASRPAPRRRRARPPGASRPAGGRPGGRSGRTRPAAPAPPRAGGSGSWWSA